MSKGIELTSTQIKAYEAGATMFLFPIKSYGFTQLEINEFKEVTCSNCGHIMYSSNNYICPNCEGSMCHNNFHIQKGDKDIFIQEEFKIHDTNNGFCNIYYKESKPNFINNSCWQPASQMTKEQSRYSFSECIDVKVIRAKHINYEQISDIQMDCSIKFEDFYNQKMQEQNINRTYEDNDYVFLVEFKRS